jgi:flagellar basal-body rod modification protein FlgD
MQAFSTSALKVGVDMQVNSATAATNSASGSLAGDMGDMFLKLLTAQLKSQDPLSPMDPTTFVGQLVQFNTLGEILKIREILQPSTTAENTAVQAATPTTQPANTQGAN